MDESLYLREGGADSRSQGEGVRVEFRRDDDRHTDRYVYTLGDVSPRSRRRGDGDCVLREGMVVAPEQAVSEMACHQRTN